MKRMRASMKAALAAGTVAGLALLALLVFAANYLWTEFQWYQSLGHTSVIVTRITSQGVLWVIAAVIASGAIFAGATVAGRQRRPQQGFTVATATVSLILGSLISWNLSTHWMTFRLAVAQSPFGIFDPQFGRDVGFFVFTLPALELANTWFNGVVVITAIVAIAIAIFPEPGDTRPVLTGRWWQLKPLFSVLFGLLVLSATFGAWLSIWLLDLSKNSQFTGAGYTDVHASIPALWVMVAVGLAIAGVAIMGARSRRWHLLAGLVGVWAVAAIVLGDAWPALMQNYVVAPNEAALEAPYLERNIAMTRTAYGLEDVRAQRFSALESLAGQAAAGSAKALSHARVWTPDSVKQAYSQLQTIRPYYKLSRIDTDRYVVDGEPSQVLVAARQIDPNALPANAKTWVNQHLVYTHGYGIAMSSAHETTQRGFPTFIVGDIPPRVASDVAATSPDLEIDEPRIYFGPDTSEYAIIDSGIDEFDYPAGEENVFYHNTSEIGVRLSSALRRLSWAVRLGSDQVLFSDYVSPDSRVLIHRDVRDRARRLAPWLAYDTDPYPAIVDGRIVWILDGYTSSDHFPYSQPLADGTNYLRDSVKVTVDAASGETNFFASGEDPIRDAWASIYPGLIRSANDVPPSLASHFRVPQKLFSAQTRIYRTYHMTDARVFYNREDQWEISGEKSDDPVKPSYVVLDPPDARTSGMYLMQPFAPKDGDNLVGWMAASCEPSDYGQQTVYALPKDHIVLGPQQVKARIDQDPTISPTLSLWNQRGSKVVFGDMLVLPVEGAIAYVQPVFLQAEKTAITELVAVVVVSGDHVEMDPTLTGALSKAFGTTGGTDSQRATQVDGLFAEAYAAQVRGDLTTYRAKLEELRETLDSTRTVGAAVTP